MTATSAIRVSVIIPCYNAARFIHETLESAYAQAIPDMEVIVVNDGSTDNSAQIIRNHFSQVILVETVNKGPGSARNLGTQKARGEFIQYLDADDILEPGKIKQQIEALLLQDADIAYGPWQDLDEIPGKGFADGVITDRLLKGDSEAAIISHFWCALHVYLFRRRILASVIWNETLKVNEDVRFVFDCALRGANFIYLPSLMAKQRKHRQSTSRRCQRYFFESCTENAIYAEAQWTKELRLNGERRRALADVYFYLAEISFLRDPTGFKQCVDNIMRLCSRYTPCQSVLLEQILKYVGMRGMMTIFLLAKHMKHLLSIKAFKK